MTTETTAAPSTSTTNTAAALAQNQNAPAATGTETQAAKPAPVAPSIGEEAAAKPEPGKAERQGAVTYDKTGDVGLDMALGFVGKLGFMPDHPAMQAASNGDFSLISAELAALGDKATGWEQYVALADKSHKDGKSAADAKNAEQMALVVEAAGGEEAWNAIKTWAGENATPAEKAEVNAALRAGGIAAKAMVAWLGEKMTGSPTRAKEPAAVARPEAKGAAPLNGAMTATDYARAVQEGRQKLGARWDGSKEYTQLQQRRLAGRRAGI